MHMCVYVCGEFRFLDVTFVCIVQLVAYLLPVGSPLVSVLVTTPDSKTLGS